MITLAHLESFRFALETALCKHKDASNPQGKGVPFVKLEMGKKYCRVVHGEIHGCQECHTCAYCFVDLSNGDILKPAGYKAPAKNGARGNILGADPLKGCGAYGVEYKRGGGGFTFEEARARNRIADAVPAGTTVVRARNLPEKDGKQYWSKGWQGMSLKERGWKDSYGFRLSEKEVKN